MDLSLFILLSFILIMILLLIIKHRKNKFEHIPYKFIATPSKVIIIDGIAIGNNTYGDLELKLCITVLSVSEGIVNYKYSNAKYENSYQLDIQEFLDTFHRFPNGCNFSSNYIIPP
jgi:hypothetical protein